MIKSNLGSEINGIQDKLDAQLFYTPEFISRHQCSSTGALTAVTSPIKLSTLIKHGDFSESIYRGKFNDNRKTVNTYAVFLIALESEAKKYQLCWESV